MDGPSLSKGGVLLGPRVWARSLEAIVFIATDRFWRISSSCMHAGTQICPTTSHAHAHRSIVQNRHVYTVLHSIPNVLAQRSHKLCGRIHTARIGTMQGPKFSNPKTVACFFTISPATYTLLCRLEQAPKPKMSRASLLDARSLVVLLQRLAWSLFW